MVNISWLIMRGLASLHTAPVNTYAPGTYPFQAKDQREAKGLEYSYNL